MPSATIACVPAQLAGGHRGSRLRLRSGNDAAGKELALMHAVILKKSRRRPT